MTPIAWNIPPLMVSSGTLNEPRSALGANAPCTTTVKMMTTILISASVLALANYKAKACVSNCYSLGSQVAVIKLNITKHATIKTKSTRRKKQQGPKMRHEAKRQERDQPLQYPDTASADN